MKPRATILVTGAPRSGTTWLGRVLSESDGVAALHEPLNPTMNATWPRIPRWFFHIDDHNGSEWREPVARALALEYPLFRGAVADRSVAGVKRHAHRWRQWRSIARNASQLVVKDPLAIFSVEWLARTFGLTPVFIVRHPAGVASSLSRLGWRPRFDHWLADEHLMDGLLAPVAADLARAASTDVDALEAAAVLWSAIAVATCAVNERLPEAIVVRYEDLADDPAGGARNLCAALGLTLSDAGVERVLASSRGEAEVDPSNATKALSRDSRAAARTWQSRLSRDEQRRVRELTSPWSERWFDASAWACVDG